MSRADELRAKANGFLLQAGTEPNPDVQNTLRQLAQSYEHLADLAGRAVKKAIVVPPVVIGDENPTGS